MEILVFSILLPFFGGLLVGYLINRSSKEKF